VGEYVILAASYDEISEEALLNTNIDGELSVASFSIGYRYGVANLTDVFVMASYVYYDYVEEVKGEGEVFDYDDNGYEINLGVRSMLTESFEGTITLGYVEINNESETAIGLSTHYHFNKVFSVGVSYSFSDDVDLYSIGARVSF